MNHGGGDKTERRKNRMPRAGRTVWRTKGKGNKSAAARVAELIHRLDDITRLVSDWVWETDRDFKIVYVSDRVFQVLGILPVQFHGRHLTEIGTFLARHDGRPMILDDRPFRDVPFQMFGVDGRRHLFLLSGLPVFDDETGRFVAVRGTARDITDQNDAEESSRRLALAIDALNDHVVLHDAQDRLVYCSAAYRRINEAVSETIVPGTLFETHLNALVAKGLVPEAVGREKEWVRYRLDHHRNPRGPIEVSRQDGLWFLMSEQKTGDGGIITAATDITEIKRAEEALRASEKRHRDFAANVAHELRTPLAVLRSRLDSMEDTSEHRAMRDEVAGMSRLLDQMLTVARLEKIPVESFEPIDLRAVGVRAAAALGHLAIAEGRSIELVGHEGAVMVRGNTDAVDQAVRNLIENAIKYSARGTTITINVDNLPESGPSLCVINHGATIPAEKRNLIFERFKRADRRAEGNGLGIGLAIVKQVAEAHNAKVLVSDVAGGGAAFQLVFPPVSSSADVRRKSG